MKPHYKNYMVEGPTKGYELVPLQWKPGWFRYSANYPFPLTRVDQYGFQYRPYKDEFDTDLASTPLVLQWLPTLRRERFILPALFHDADYRFHKRKKSIDVGRTWFTVDVTREQADNDLRDGIGYAPKAGNSVQSNVYWIGVRLFGWIPWRK